MEQIQLFNYGATKETDQYYLKQAEDELHRLLPYRDTQTFKIGKILLGIKNRSDINIEEWFAKKFGLKPYCITLYTKVEERLGHEAERLKHLPLNTLYKLSSPRVPKEFLDMVLLGEIIPTRTMIDRIIGTSTREIRRGKREARVTKGFAKQIDLLQKQIDLLQKAHISSNTHSIPVDVQQEIRQLKENIEQKGRQNHELIEKLKEAERQNYDLHKQNELLEEKIASISALISP